MEDEELLEIVQRLGGTDVSEEEVDEIDDFAALRDEHCASENDAWDESPVSTSLAKWLDSDDVIVRRGAAVALAEIAPAILLQQVRRRIPSRFSEEKRDPLRMSDYVQGVNHAIGQLQEHYFGSYCPGCLDALAENPVAHQQEYEKLERVCRPVADFFHDQSCGAELAKLLENVRPEAVT